MYSTLFSVALFASLAVQGALAFAVNTPEMDQCKSVKFTWEPTKAPYSVAIVKAETPCEEPILEFPDTELTYLTWDAVNITQGTQVQISILDKDDAEAWSKNITVGGSDDSCLNGKKASPPTSTSTTLSVPAAANAAGSPSSTSAPAAPTTTDAATPVGAAGGGLLGDDDNGAFASVSFSLSTITLSVAIAAIGLAL